MYALNPLLTVPLTASRPAEDGTQRGTAHCLTLPVPKQVMQATQPTKLQELALLWVGLLPQAHSPALCDQSSAEVPYREQPLGIRLATEALPEPDSSPTRQLRRRR